MKKMIYGLIIALAFVVPATARAAEETDIQCMCNGGEECQHRLPARTFKDFSEWEDYYLTHREIGIFWDSYLYRTYAYRYDKDGNILYRPPLCYPFNDINTWKNWFYTCWEKQAKGVYKYEYPYGKTR